jgi:hypothetical protein
MPNRIGAALKAPFTLEGIAAGLIWYGLPAAVVWVATAAASWLLSLTVPTAIAMGIALTLLAVVGVAFYFNQRQKAAATPEKQAESDFEVLIEREEWQVINSVLLLQVKTRVRNLTDDRKQIGGITFQAEDGWDYNDPSIVQHIGEIGASRPTLPSKTDPRDSVSGWNTFAFVRRPQGGTPGYIITISDQLHNQQSVSVPAKPSRTGLTRG